MQIIAIGIITISHCHLDNLMDVLGNKLYCNPLDVLGFSEGEAAAQGGITGGRRGLEDLDESEVSCLALFVKAE